MIIFLYGQDSYRSRQKLQEIISHYKKSGKSGLNLVQVDASQTDFLDFFNNFKVSPMFSEKKLIILKNLFSGPSSQNFQEYFLKEIKKLQNILDVIVVFEENLVDQRLKIFKILTKECKSQEFRQLDSKGLKTWAQKEFDNLSQKINTDALDLFLNYVGNDLWRVSNEVKKLANFKSGFTIKKEDIELQVKPKLETDIFKTIDALAEKDKKQALLFLQKHLDAGDSPLYLLSMVAYQFRNLLLVKELAEKGLMYGSIIKKSGLHPFVVKKSYFLCQQFSLEKLKKIYRQIFQIDSDIKKGKIEAETALDLLVGSI